MLNWIYGWYEPTRHGSPEALARTFHRIALCGAVAQLPLPQPARSAACRTVAAREQEAPREHATPPHRSSSARARSSTTTRSAPSRSGRRRTRARSPSDTCRSTCPRPLLEAIGCLPVAVFGGGDALDIIRGDSYFQSYICHIPRSTVELGLGGHLDALDGMVFPSICDVIRNLGGMWQMLFPQKYAAYLDLPQNFDRDVGGRFYAREMRRIARELEARGARPLERRRAARGDRARGPAPARCSRSSTPSAAPSRGACGPARRTSSSARARVLTADEHTTLLRRVRRGGQARARRARRQRARRAGRAPSASSRRSSSSARSRRRAATSSTTTSSSACASSTAPSTRAAARTRSTRWRAPSSSTGAATASRYIGDHEKGAALVARVRACARRGRHLRRGVVLRSRAARPADARGGARPARASRTRASSSPRTPGSSRSFASRPARSPTPSSSGEPQASCSRRRRPAHERADESKDREPAPAEADDRRPLREASRARRRRARRSSTRSSPATSPSSSARSTCCRCCPRSTRCSRACARRSRGLHRRGREGRALGGRLHVREVRHRHAQERQHRPHRARSSPSPICCCSRTRAASRS